jgi:histidinol-phosphate aminotransferase
MPEPDPTTAPAGGPITAPVPKPWVAAIAPYVPGKAKALGDKPAIKLSANESALGTSPHALGAYARASTTLDRYPDGTAHALRMALAAHFDVAFDEVLCGAGSDDILLLAAQAFAGPGDEIIGMRYGFAIYPICAARVGARYVEVPDSDFTGSVDNFLKAVTPNTKLIYIANPNNPTGTYMPWSEIERLHNALPPHILLVLDGAYAEYVDLPDYRSGLELAKTAPNVLHTRTFSKIYGLPALRLGFGIAHARVIDAINRVRAPFNLATPALMAGIAALEDQAFVAQAKQQNDEWRAWLTAQVARLGLQVIPSVCNFVLIRFPEQEGLTAQAANEALLAQGYILRWLPNQGLPDCLRLTVGLEAENRGVIEALTKFVESVAWRRHNSSAESV